MPYNFSAPDDFGEIHASELHTSLGESIGAQGGEAFMGGVRGLYRGVQYGAAENEGAETLGSQISRLQNGEDLSDLVEHPQPTAVDVPIDDARARVKQEGLEGQFKLPDQPTIRKPVLDLMLQHAHEQAEYNAATARGPQGFLPGALGMITSIGAGMIDPVNAAAFSIPVLGEARWGQMLASAGESLTQRAGVKALQGAAQGAAGSAALIPGDWWLHTKDGQDYTMADALKSVVMGAGMGAAAHAGFGALSDVRARARGLPLPGSPEDLVLRGLMHGTHVPAAALESQGLPAEEIPGIAGPHPAANGGSQPLETLPATEAIPPHPAEILADLPPAAREDAYRATAADVIAGRPARAAEMLQESAKEDPRIAESLAGEPAPAAAAESDDAVHVQARKVGGPRARPEATRSLFEHIAANGGLRSDDPMIPDVRSSLGRDNHFVPGFGNLIRKPGQVSSAAARSGARSPMSLDTARESAVEAGYLEDQGAHTGGQSTSTVRHLLDAIDTEARGNRVYRNGAEPPRSARDEAQHEHELNNAFEKGLSDNGVDLDRIPSKTRDRTLEIMDREGVTDPLDAYERAVMEETEHGAQAGEHERIPESIPGWDVDHDAGAAHGAGGAAEAGGERAAGDAARDAGEGDRAAGRPAAASAQRGVADFQKFADGKRAVDDPDEVAASKAADKTPEPQSIEPTKAVSAAEAAAKEADQLVADILPTLSEKERKVFEDALRELKDDKEARDQVVRDGAACLAAAVA